MSDLGLTIPVSDITKGLATVFRKAEGLWQHSQIITVPDAPQFSHRFGNGIALTPNGSRLAIGMSYASGVPNLEFRVGIAYLFDLVDGQYVPSQWMQPNPGTTKHFGLSLCLSADGSQLISGARNSDSGGSGVNSSANKEPIAASGDAYIFTLP